MNLIRRIVLKRKPSKVKTTFEFFHYVPEIKVKQTVDLNMKLKKNYKYSSQVPLKTGIVHLFYKIKLKSILQPNCHHFLRKDCNEWFAEKTQEPEIKCTTFSQKQT